MKYRRNAVITARALCVAVAQQPNIGGVVVATGCSEAAGERRRVGLVASASFSTVSISMHQQIVKWWHIYFLSKSCAEIRCYPKLAHGLRVYHIPRFRRVTCIIRTNIALLTSLLKVGNFCYLPCTKGSRQELLMLPGNTYLASSSGTS